MAAAARKGILQEVLDELLYEEHDRTVPHFNADLVIQTIERALEFQWGSLVKSFVQSSPGSNPRFPCKKF